MDSGEQVVSKVKFDALALKTKELLAANQSLKVERDSIRADAAKLAAALKAKSAAQDTGSATFHLVSSPSVQGFNFIDGSSMSPSIPLASASTSVSGFSFVSAAPSLPTSEVISLPSSSHLLAPTALPSAIESTSRLAQELKKAHATIKQLQQEHSLLEANHLELQQECGRLTQRVTEAEQQHAIIAAKAKHWEEDARSRIWESAMKPDAAEQALLRAEALSKELEISRRQEQAAKNVEEELRVTLQVAQAEAESLRCQLEEKGLSPVVNLDTQIATRQAELTLLQSSSPLARNEVGLVKEELRTLREELASIKMKEEAKVEKYESEIREMKKKEEVQQLTVKRKEEELKELSLELDMLRENRKNSASNKGEDVERALAEIRLELQRKEDIILEMRSRQEQQNTDIQHTKAQGKAETEARTKEFQNEIVRLKKMIEDQEKFQQDTHQKNEHEQSRKAEEIRRTLENRQKEYEEMNATYENLRGEIESLKKREKEWKEQEKAREKSENQRSEAEEEQRKQLRAQEAETNRMNQQQQVLENEKNQLRDELKQIEEQLRASDHKNQQFLSEIKGMREELTRGEDGWKDQLRKREQEIKEELDKDLQELREEIGNERKDKESLLELLRKERDDFRVKEATWKEEEKQRELYTQAIEQMQQTIESKEAQISRQKEESGYLEQELQQTKQTWTEREDLWKKETEQKQEQESQKKTAFEEMKKRYEKSVSELNQKASELTQLLYDEKAEREREQQERQKEFESMQRQVAEEREQETQLRITQTQALERALAALKAEKEELERTQNRLEIERLDVETLEREENERTIFNLQEAANSAKAALEVRENELRDVTSAHSNCEARLQALKAQHTTAIEVVEREMAEIKRQLTDAKAQATGFQVSLEEATSKEIKLACVIANLEQSLAHQAQAATAKQEELSDSVAMLEMELETLRKLEGERDSYQAKVEKLENQLASSQGTCIQQLTHLEELRTTVQGLEELIKKQEHQISQFDQVREGHDGELATYRAHLDDLTQTITSLRAQIDAGTSKTQQIANVEQVNQELTERLQTLQTERLKREEDFRQQLKQKEDELANSALEYDEAKNKAVAEAASLLEDRQRMLGELVREKEISQVKEKELAEQSKQIQDLKQLLRQVEVKLRGKLAALAEKEAESKTQGEQLITMQLALLEAKRVLSEREVQITTSSVKCSELLCEVDSKDQLTAEINAKLLAQTREAEELKGQLDHFKQQVLKKHNKWKKLEETQIANYNELVKKHDAAQTEIARLQESVRALTLEGRKKDQNISDQTDAILKLCATEHDLRTKLGLAAKRERDMVAGMAKALQK